MADVLPFRGLRYTPAAGNLSNLIAPPYDIIPNAERERLHNLDSHNVIRVEYGRERPGFDKYADARDALAEWQRDGALARDDTPSFYVTEHSFTDRGEKLVRRGLLGALRIYPEGNDQVLPHERTIPKDRADRLNLIRQARANTSPIFGMVDDADGRLAAALDTVMRGAPTAEATVGSEHHRIWRVDGATASSLAAILAPRRVYLADGHHRYEVAREYLAEERAAGRRTAQDDPAAFVLAFICSLTDPGLRVYSTHRVIAGARKTVEDAIAKSFTTAPAADAARVSLGVVRDGKAETLTPKNVDRASISPAVRGLPVADAEAFFAEPARAAGGTVTFTSITDEAVAAAKGDTVTILAGGIDGPVIKKIADAGERMPIKSTYFFPKVPAGLVLRPLD